MYHIREEALASGGESQSTVAETSCWGNKVQSVQGEHPQRSMLVGGPTSHLLCAATTTLTISTTTELSLHCYHSRHTIIVLPAAITLLPSSFILGQFDWAIDLAGSTLEGLAEHEELDLCKTC